MESGNCGRTFEQSFQPEITCKHLRRFVLELDIQCSTIHNMFNQIENSYWSKIRLQWYFSKVPLQSAIFRVHISNLLIWPISPYEIQLNTDIIPISSLVSLILPILSPRWRWCRPILLIEYPYSRLPIKSFWLSKTSSDDYVSTIIDHSIFLICTIYSIN